LSFRSKTDVIRGTAVAFLWYWRCATSVNACLLTCTYSLTWFLGGTDVIIEQDDTSSGIGQRT